MYDVHSQIFCHKSFLLHSFLISQTQPNAARFTKDAPHFPTDVKLTFIKSCHNGFFNPLMILALDRVLTWVFKWRVVGGGCPHQNSHSHMTPHVRFNSGKPNDPSYNTDKVSKILWQCLVSIFLTCIQLIYESKIFWKKIRDPHEAYLLKTMNKIASYSVSGLSITSACINLPGIFFCPFSVPQLIFHHQSISN